MSVTALEHAGWGFFERLVTPDKNKWSGPIDGPLHF
jgi:hypothetical protein